MGHKELYALSLSKEWNWAKPGRNAPAVDARPVMALVLGGIRCDRRKISIQLTHRVGTALTLAT
jgi:hypothetical protein